MPLRDAAQIRFEHVSLAFGSALGRARLQVLEDVNFDVAAGEFICIIGPSGCGKSTILSLCAGYLQPDAGRILVNRMQVAGPGSDRVMVFQNAALFPWFTAAETVAYGLRLAANRKKVRYAPTEVERLLELVGLRRFGTHYPFELSGAKRRHRRAIRPRRGAGED
jgi:NitT/TauT family transport system ATP-binding protein